MADFDEKQLAEAIEPLKALMDINDDQESILEGIIKLLSMPDDEFSILAPSIMQNFQQSLNNPEDKLSLVQSLNANGLKAEDLMIDLDSLEAEIESSSLPRMKRDFLIEMVAGIVNAINSTEGIAKRIVPVAIEFCNENAKRPEYAHLTDSGMDVYALEDITINPGETVLVPTGIKVALPAGFELQVRPKSGRALKTKLRVANTPGTIDQGYRDEIKVIIENIDPPIRAIHFENKKPIDPITIGDIDFGSPYTIGKGEKFCQLVLMEVPKASFYEVETVQDIGEDRNGGFGSTGLK